MKRQIILLVIVVIVLMAVGCATTPPYKPFKIDQNKFYANTKTIALAPCWIRPDLEVSGQVIEKFELLIGDKLSEAGFSVVSSKHYRDIWKRMIEQMGGYFDPKTGKRDESKFKAVREHCYRELGRKFNSDAVLISRIMIIEAPFYQGFNNLVAQWGGAEEPFDIRHGAIRFLDTTIKSGTIPALSLGVIIYDIHGTTVYVNRGGIQVLAKYSGSLVPVPKDELFVYDERNVAAVNFALEPLIQKSGSPE